MDKICRGRLAPMRAHYVDFLRICRHAFREGVHVRRSAQTRAYYERMGLVPIEVFPEPWGLSNPCLQKLKLLESLG
ncbi:hypothetical protein GGD41_004009 [Paraburkholderia bryophila]|uniref:Uncharacterized protein n=1 Tax=Paraburkholderia bryophila TaxID=420952 RepID=A0A7Y9W9S6_9BURK|nr:hypothetical protein [Paraburkholderia bryophila]